MTTLNTVPAPLISVIIPVYNVEPYIEKCLSSLRTQTMKELEFIIVDDCGVDRSIDIAHEFAILDSRFRILKGTENLGVGPARNRGLEAARGEYIGFVDPDDWIAPDFFQLLYEKATSERADIARGKMCRIRNTNIQEDTSNDRIRKGLANSRWIGLTFFYGFWLAIYKRDILHQHNINFPAFQNGEDVYFLLNYLLHSDNVALEDRALYFYCERSDSAVNKITAKYFEDAFLQIKARGELINNSSLPRETVIDFWESILI